LKTGGTIKRRAGKGEKGTRCTKGGWAEEDARGKEGTSGPL